MPSTRRNPRLPEGLPELFVDRSLGRLVVPAALRSMGFEQAIRASAARVFRVGRGARNAELQIAWIATNVHRIVLRSRRSGPYVDVIRERSVERDWLQERQDCSESLDFK